MKTLTFLIAHENPVFRNILKRYLEQRGCRTYEAGSALEARSLATLEHPDVLIAHEAPPFRDLLDSPEPGSAKKPLTIFLNDVDGLSGPDQEAVGKALRLSKSEFMEMLTMGGPLLFAFLLTLLQS